MGRSRFEKGNHSIRMLFLHFLASELIPEPIQLSWSITTISRVYGTYDKLVAWGYKSNITFGGPSCSYI